MKAALLLLLLLTAWPGRAQELFAPLPVDAPTQLITYSDVVATPGVSQATLLAHARAWANRVSLTDKPPLLVSEQGINILLVAGSQRLSPVYAVRPQTLFYLVRIALREGRYQYRFEEYTLVTPSPTGPNVFETAEVLFQAAPPPRTTGSSYATRQRRAFDEATAQAAISLHTAFSTSLLTPTAAGTDW